MLRRSFRLGIIVGLLGGAVAALAKAFSGSRAAPPAPAAGPPTWTPIPDAEPLRAPAPAPAPEPEPVTPMTTTAPEPAPAPAPAPAPKAEPTVVAALQEAPPAKKKAPAAKKARKKLEPWVQPEAGTCPGTHPVKGKLASKIFHIPGGFNYARTVPDRCYIDAAAAEADGLRQSKR